MPISEIPHSRHVQLVGFYLLYFSHIYTFFLFVIAIITILENMALPLLLFPLLLFLQLASPSLYFFFVMIKEFSVNKTHT